MSKDFKLRLINCSPEILESILAGDEELSETLNVNIAENWTTFGDEVFRQALLQIEKDPMSQKWQTYLAILIENNTLIGNGGFKGPPDENSTVEIGYEIAKAYQENGYGTEMAIQLVNKAFRDVSVIRIIAHTLEKNNNSTAILKKCGFKSAGKLEDPEDGWVYLWELLK